MQSKTNEPLEEWKIESSFSARLDDVDENLFRQDDEEEEIVFVTDDDPEHTVLTSTAGGTSSASSFGESRDDQEPEMASFEASISDDSPLLMRAVFVMFFCVFTDSINVQCAAPNFALMVSPGAHPDSFPHTEPFGFAAAQYMILSAASTGAFLANIGAGWLSGRIGQRRMILINMLGSVVFSLAKYGARHDYWTFVAMAFANGCFSSTPSVGLGYMADLFLHDRVKGDTYMSHIVAVFVIGRTAGGFLAVITPNSLFFPQISAAIISAVGLVMAYFFLLDPSQIWEEEEESEEMILRAGEDDGGMKKRMSKRDSLRASIVLPEKLDKVTLFNILFGSVIDYAGSLGLITLSVSALMFQTFHLNFIEDGLEPVMSEQTYRILYSVAASSIVVGAAIAPFLFKKIGVAVSCVLANLATGAFIIALLYIALIEPATRTTFAIYTTVLYIGYPLGIISQISTGPMLDRVTPLDKKLFIQGINGALCDGSFAVFPFLYALLVDNFGIAVALWTSTGVCCLAALVNLPLVFHPLMGKTTQSGKEEAGEEEALNATSRTAFSSTISLQMVVPPSQMEEEESEQHDDDDEVYSC